MDLSIDLIRKLEELDPKMKDVFLCFMEEVDEKTKIITVGRGDFDELKNVVRQLAEAQNLTEHRIEEFVEAQRELTKAQKRTENRVEELATAQIVPRTALRNLPMRRRRPKYLYGLWLWG